MSPVILKLMIFSFGLTPLMAQLTSYRVENVEALNSVSDDGRLVLYAERVARVRIFSSRRLGLNPQISFTNAVGAAGGDCSDQRKTDVFDASEVDNATAVVTVVFTKSDAALDGRLMFCFRDREEAEPGGLARMRRNWIHQGSDAWMTLSLTTKDDQKEVALVWVKSFLVPVALFLSAVFSGLSLTLLSLTRSELKVMRNQGGSEEKRYSKVVSPLRKRGNVLFCGLLLLNTLANVVVVVLLHELIGLFSILAGTLLVVFLGEIVPQTVCSKYGLSFGSKMSCLTDAFFVATLPFSYPVGKAMDAVLDGEVPAVYDRDRFREMLSRSERPRDAPPLGDKAAAASEDSKPFKLSNRTVGDVMIRLDDAYMEEYDGVLTADKISEILRRGYTRVPVYEKDRWNVVALLHVRDLALIDPKDRLTLKAVCKFYNRPVNFVFEDTKLTVMLEEFKKGQSHMAFVQRVNDEGPGDPYYETLGMITLEDVIDDIFHSSDSSSSVAPKQSAGSVFDPRIHFQDSKISSDLERLKFNQYLALHRKRQIGGHRERRHGDASGVESLPENLLHAVEHFLPTVLAFQPDLISPSVLGRLLRQGSVVRAEGAAVDGPAAVVVVEKGRPMDHFLLVLEGRVKVTIGADDLEFVEGPFAHFGLPALLNALAEGGVLPPRGQIGGSEYVPDFTVRPSSREVLYLSLSLSSYLGSVQATSLQRMSRPPDSSSDLSRSRNEEEEEEEEEDSFVEANNAKNSFLNHHHHLVSQGFSPNPDHFGGMGDCHGLSPEYPYRGDGDSWTARGLPSIPKKSPSDDWLDAAAKRETPSGGVPSDGCPSAPGGETPVRPLSREMHREEEELK